MAWCDFGKDRLQFKVMKDMALIIATAKIYYMFDTIKSDYAELCLGILIFPGVQRTNYYHTEKWHSIISGVESWSGVE